MDEAKGCIIEGLGPRLSDMIYEEYNTLKEFADEIGLSESYVYRVTQDRRSLNLKKFVHACEVLNANPIFLLWGEGKKYLD